jgi:hypothetical protein
VFRLIQTFISFRSKIVPAGHKKSPLEQSNGLKLILFYANKAASGRSERSTQPPPVFVGHYLHGVKVEGKMEKANLPELSYCYAKVCSIRSAPRYECLS